MHSLRSLAAVGKKIFEMNSLIRNRVKADTLEELRMDSHQTLQILPDMRVSPLAVLFIDDVHSDCLQVRWELFPIVCEMGKMSSVIAFRDPDFLVDSLKNKAHSEIAFKQAMCQLEKLYSAEGVDQLLEERGLTDQEKNQVAQILHSLGRSELPGLDEATLIHLWQEESWKSAIDHREPSYLPHLYSIIGNQLKEFSKEKLKFIGSQDENALIQHNTFLLCVVGAIFNVVSETAREVGIDAISYALAPKEFANRPVADNYQRYRLARLRKEAKKSWRGARALEALWKLWGASIERQEMTVDAVIRLVTSQTILAFSRWGKGMEEMRMDIMTSAIEIAKLASADAEKGVYYFGKWETLGKIAFRASERAVLMLVMSRGPKLIAESYRVAEETSRNLSIPRTEAFHRRNYRIIKESLDSLSESTSWQYQSYLLKEIYRVAEMVHQAEAGGAVQIL